VNGRCNSHLLPTRKTQPETNHDPSIDFKVILLFADWIPLP